MIFGLIFVFCFNIMILLQVLRNILQTESHKELCIRLCSNDAKNGTKTVAIGDVSIAIRDAASKELVPVRYLAENPPQSILQHLKWIMQKDALGQDVFLIGSPGPLRRQVAMMYLELTQREGEYVSLSRDTTETDLKQRREIRSGTAYYMDQSAVNAALNGRILVLEGIEKAERNVLPILNNLLENREMQLDDGRFLMAAERYDKLLLDHTKEELDAMKLVRVSERFRVIALGHPVPRYRGNALDPPLRSRFQSRDVNTIPFKEQVEMLQEVFQKIPTQKISQIVSLGTAINTKESSAVGLPDFPLSNVPKVVKILNSSPDMPASKVISRLYPHEVMLSKEGRTAVGNLLEKFDLTEKESSSIFGSKDEVISGIEKKDDNSSVVKTNKKQKFVVPSGLLNSADIREPEVFVPTKYHQGFLAEMMQSHLAHDFCIVGPRGCGKSLLVNRMAQLLGYEVEQIMLYQDMTSRDLLQQRITQPNGDTDWRLSPLVEAALEGRLAVLDGVHRINQGSFAVLHRLIHDRELQLFDGTRLIHHDRFEAMKQKSDLTTEELMEKKILPIHPSFRIAALSEPPVPGSSSQQWMTPELLTMFLFHHLRPLSLAEETQVVQKVVPGCPDIKKLMNFVHQMRESADPTMMSISSSLSTRQIIRVAKRLAKFPSKDLHGIIHKACLANFLPSLPKISLEQALEAAEIRAVKNFEENTDTDEAITCEVNDGSLRIGKTSVPVYNPENRTKVPDVLFYENPMHLSVMEDMLKDFDLGEHLLLVGNQGVGKNKIVDRFLHLLNRPREYIQLHRDTTVQTLTLQPLVKGGVIVYEDSPLVRAVKEGHVLVVDEADKAPTHVTCILKTLIETGEMHLADGRRIVSQKSGIKPSPSVIIGHPDFRMIVLANRPGFPFLGNDFFGAMGDIFSCHAINNPDMKSEMSMLRRYGPDVPETTLEKLVQAFGDLRNMADQGLISYPYSTREVVNIVRHLNKYPNDGLRTVVRNVFDFDSYSKELQETIVNTMQRHGIPFGSTKAEVNLAQQYLLPSFQLQGVWNIAGSGDRRRTAPISLPIETSEIDLRGPIEIAVQDKVIERMTARATTFTEQEAFWTIPMHDTNIISDVAVSKATNSPVHEGDFMKDIRKVSSVPLHDVVLSKSLGSEMSGPNRPIVTTDSYSTLLVGFPGSNEVQVHSVPREPLPEEPGKNPITQGTSQILGLFGSSSGSGGGTSTQARRSQIVHLPESGQIIQSLPMWKVPVSIFPDKQRPTGFSGFLEVVDPANHILRYIPVPSPTRYSPYTAWLYSMSDTSVFIAPASNDGLVTVDSGGCVRLWETALINLERSLTEWKNMMGFDDGKPLQVTYDRESGRKADGPKHGKIDPKNAPHVGGNTWAGGTGGSNTAGLGGLGGPYRLDSGHTVYQVPQHEKDAVPEEVREAAREMAQKAFKERLREINMSEYDADMYDSFSGSVRSQVQSLRVILDSLQAKGKERQWLKNQSYGDLDDSKLIEGITGEKSIYKRRGEKEPELGTPQEKPKRLRLVVDVSGSMYRFNGYDGRLEREMESTLMMMEALEKYEEKFKYDVIGHSGEDYKVELVMKDKIPQNNKERLIVLKTMHAHSQFCISGDNTLHATKHAIETLAEEEADEHFVIILSDANFDRYGISPRKFGEILKGNDKVNAYAIFIGSLEDQADQLIKQLPMGHSFVCLDTKSLPQILQQIFTSTMLSGR
ncbi:hypothetical protein FSP39_010820 [Pinctada imbricata]|uniref:von Willebrand factor A domain-containing protein 8 n=1 Tax=Pinctada imbricata TaxID=66713 RepID=A0AA88Y000_PINIB|nr:hypothetical protein FSP39_010820 [Pinctada imbricata]